jgi:hypothetical protein
MPLGAADGAVIGVAGALYPEPEGRILEVPNL